MDEFKLDMSNSSIFIDNSLLIDKKVTFIFGKNGTGKSTLASLLKEQVKDYDFRCFQGFEGIVGENRRLNAVILGEENNEIERAIEEIEKEISNKEKEILYIKKSVEPPVDDSENLYREFQNIMQDYEKQQGMINKFCTAAAKQIKNLNNPQLARPTYNINDFKEEISKAKLLSEREFEQHKKQINTEIKVATAINFTLINYNDLLRETNQLLSKAVIEKEIIPEISGNINKRGFAEVGLELHDINEKCAFCGNTIRADRYKKLERYFSANDIQKFRNEIEAHVTMLNNKVKEVDKIILSGDDFFPEYSSEIDYIKLSFNDKKSDVIKFLQSLIENVDNKLKTLFEKSNELKLIIPDSFDKEIEEFNKLVIQNNESDVGRKREKSKNELRFNEIKKLLDEFKYDDEVRRLCDLETKYNAKKSIFDMERAKIVEIENCINDFRSKIVELQLKTTSEKILADNINKKLKLYVNFNLEYVPNKNEKGYYLIKCKNTGECRDITQLSSGEKNIIAFLYFIEKINEVNNPNSNLSKVIVFDDPMNSNDDTMQYLIIEELNLLIKALGNKDKILIMTHNNHFYLNIKYGYKNYMKNLYLRLQSNGKNTIITRLTNAEEDFKTNYEALWNELKFLYINAPSEAMLLNPIRRIVETYTKFNSISKSKMLGAVLGAEKLFNVNSHSIDDLEADLNGRTKEDIIKIMKDCFEQENALNHFNQYWDVGLLSS